MKILVPVKRVADPDNANKVRAAADGRSVDTGELKWTRNPFDDYAVEAALRLNENAATKEKLGDVVVVSLGPEAAIKDALARPIAMGAARRIHVDVDDTALDSLAAASILHAITEKEAPDLVLMGKQAVDGDSNAVGQMLAELLGWPMATFARIIEAVDGGKSLSVSREVDNGLLRVIVTLPAVVTVDLGIVNPSAVINHVTPEDALTAEGVRIPPLKGVIAAGKAPTEKISLSDLGVDASTGTHYSGFERPAGRGGETVFVESAEELVKKLREEAKVL